MADRDDLDPLATESDPLAEYESILEQARAAAPSSPDQAPPLTGEEPVGVSETAKSLEKDGFFADQEAKHTISGRIAGDDAHHQSGKALFGDWDKLDDKGRSDWIKGEKEYTDRSAGWWDSIDKNVLAPRRRAIEETGGKAEDDPFQTWAERKIREQVAWHKQRRANADLMEQGLKEAPKYGDMRQIAEATVHGVVDGVVANVVKGMSYAGAAAEGLGYDRDAPGTVLGALTYDAKPMGKVEERGLYKVGKDISDWADARFPKDKARAEEFKTKFGEGLGSMIGFMGPAAALSIARFGLSRAGVSVLPDLIATVGEPVYVAGYTAAPTAARMLGGAAASAGAVAGYTGSLAQEGSMGDDALKAFKSGKTVDGRPVSESDILAATLLAVPIGFSEAFPIATLFDGQKGHWIKRILTEAKQEGGQEFGQQIAENITARHFYDDKRRWDDNAWDGAAIGGLLGAKSQAIADTVRWAKGQEQEGKEAEKAVKEAKARAGGTKTDVEPAAAPAEAAKPEAPKDTYDVKQFFPEEFLGRETEAQADAAKRPSSSEEGAALRDVPLEDKVSGVKEELEPTRIAAMAVKKSAPAVAVGDDVQWTSQGADQFTEPRPVRALSPDGKWAFVEGSNTAVPVSELVKVVRLEPWQQKLSETLAEIAKPLTPEARAAPADRQPRQITTPDGSMEVEAAPAVVELDTLRLASGEFQPRDRSRAESEAGVRERAANLDPERLQPSRVSDGGAPIVSEDGTIISGNGRVMSIAEVYRDPALKAQADAYRASLGPEAEGMRQPVLISRLPAGMQRADMVKFADLSNRPAVAGMSAPEKATRDARAAGADIMGLYQGGSFTAPQNAEFFRAFTNQAVSSAERGTISRNGVLTKEGEDRMAAAVLAAAYGDSELLSRMLESTDDNIRSITGAMRDAAGAFIRLKEAIRRGEADPQFDITAPIAETAKTISALREKGSKIEEFLSQQDAFTSVDPIVEALLRAFYTEKKNSAGRVTDKLGQPLSREKLTELLTSYAEEAAKHRSDGLIPDETSAEEIVAFARERALRSQTLQERLAASQGDLLRGKPAAGQSQPAARPGPSGGAPAGARSAGQGRSPEPSRGTARPAGQQPQQAQASPAERDYQRNIRGAFRSLVAGNTPPKEWGAWAKRYKITPQQLKELVDEGVRDGLLRIYGKKRRVRRTELAKPAKAPIRPADDIMALPPDVRVGERIQVRGLKNVPPDVVRWAVNIEGAIGQPQRFAEQMALLKGASRTGDLSVKDMRDLAAILGLSKIETTKKGKRTLSQYTKAEAIAAIQARHDELMKGRQAQADRRNLGVELASIAGAREDGQQQKVELDKLGFYSKALEAAKALKQAKGTPEQMLAQLKTAGVKEAEIKATGLDKFLGRETGSREDAAKRPSSSEAGVSGEEGRSADAARKSVSRQEIISFLTQNRVEVRESRYGGLDDYTRRIQEDELPSDVVGAPRWSQYSLDPSNPTYRETVLHMPAEPLSYEKWLSNRASWDKPSADTPALRAEYQRMVDAGEMADPAKKFSQGHFSEPNVIAHARTSLQKDADGKAVFVIDELQSDWGQKLRDGGARDEGKIAELEKREDAIRDEAAALRKELADSLGARLDNTSNVSAWLNDIRGRLVKDAPEIKRIDEVLNRWRLIDAELTTARASVPGHPLVSTTDQWTSTAFRRLIRQAVEAGASSIAIIPGKVAAERFNLAKQVDGLMYLPPDPASGRAEQLAFRRPGGPAEGSWQYEPIGSGRNSEKTLEEFVGKELAQKLREAPPATDDHGDLGWLSIPDLGSVEIGGHGMKATYDSIYPRTLGKLLSKIDPVIKQEEVSLQSSLDGRTFRGNSNDPRDAVTNEKGPAILFHSFPLTQKVKDTALGEGLALFSFAGVRGAQNLADSGRPSAKEAIALADRMEREGADRDAIWVATADLLEREDPELIGVFRHRDGLWRIEVDDSSAHRALLRRSGKLSSVLKHDVLYDIYPGLGDVRTRSDGRSDWGSAYYDPGRPLGFNKGYNDIYLHGWIKWPRREAIGYSGDTKERQTRALAHEAQHGIEEREDFARGAGAGSGKSYRRYAGEVEARNVQRRLRMSADERRDNPPWKTQDVPDEDQIVVRRGLDNRALESSQLSSEGEEGRDFGRETSRQVAPGGGPSSPEEYGAIEAVLRDEFGFREIYLGDGYEATAQKTAEGLRLIADALSLDPKLLSNYGRTAIEIGREDEKTGTSELGEFEPGGFFGTPTLRVADEDINTLIHEIGHAFDSGLSKKQRRFASEKFNPLVFLPFGAFYINPTTFRTKARWLSSEGRSAFRGLMEALKERGKDTIRERSKVADDEIGGFVGKGYHSAPAEIFARAFQSYVAVKAKERGYSEQQVDDLFELDLDADEFDRTYLPPRLRLGDRGFDRVVAAFDRLFASIRERSSPETGILAALSSRPFTPAFRSAAPQFQAELERQLARMVPQDVAVRVADRLFDRNGRNIEYFGRYNHDQRLLEIALAHGADKARLTGRHETVHVLREMGLWWDSEWNALVERAKKVGIDEEINARPSPIDGVSFLDAYRQLYSQYATFEGYEGEALEARVEELIDQERVANLAEKWAGGATFGSTVDDLLDRIARFFEAIRNALNGLGFQTADDIFERMVSGEIADRAGRREPAFDRAEGRMPLDLVDTSHAQILSSPEGQEAMRSMGLMSISSWVGGPVERVVDWVKAQYYNLGYEFEYADSPSTARDLAMEEGIRFALNPSATPTPIDAANGVRAILSKGLELRVQLQVEIDKDGRDEVSRQSYRRSLARVETLIADARDRLAAADELADEYRRSGMGSMDPANEPGTKASRFSVIEGGKGVELLSIASAPPSPEPFLLSNPNLNGEVTTKDKGDGNRVKTYKVFGRETSSPEAPGDRPSSPASFVLSEQPDGSWELSFFNAEKDALSILSDIEADLGNRIGPSGWLTPEGYAHWKNLAPDKVKDHQDTGVLFQGMWASPKALQLAIPVLQEAATSNREEGRTAAATPSTSHAQKLSHLQSLLSNVQGGTSLASISSFGDTIGGIANRIEALTDWVVAKYKNLGFEDEEATIPDSASALAQRRGIQNATRAADTSPISLRRVIESAGERRDRALLVREKVRAKAAEMAGFPDPYRVRDEKLVAALKERAIADPAFREVLLDAAQLVDESKQVLDEVSGLHKRATDLYWSSYGMGGRLGPNIDPDDAANQQFPGRPRLSVIDGGKSGPVELASIKGSGLPNPIRLGDVNAQPSLDRPRKSLTDLVEDLNDTLGLTTRYGRIDPGLARQAGRAGQRIFGHYSRSTGVTRLAIPNDFGTLAHEGGHALENMPEIRDQLIALKRQHAQELVGNLSDPNSLPQAVTTAPTTEDLSEAFAEFFRLYLTNPTLAEQRAPQFLEAFQDMMDGEEPGILHDLDDMQEAFQALLTQSPAAAVRSRIQSTRRLSRLGEFAQELGEKGFKATISDKLYAFFHGYTDRWHGLKVATQYLLREGAQWSGTALAEGETLTLKAINDPYKRARLAAQAKAQATAMLLNGVKLRGTTDFSGPSYQDALAIAFGGKRRADWDETKAELFGSYLIARSMLAEFDRFDRGELENVPDELITREVWHKALADLEMANPQFARGAEALYQFQKNVLKLMFQEGFLTPESYQEYSNRVDYVPRNRVLADRSPSSLGAPTAARGNNKRKVFFRFHGSTLDFINPLESIAQNVYGYQARITLNGVVLALDQVARWAGPAGGSVAERLPARDMTAVRVGVRETMQAAIRQLDPEGADGLLDMVEELFDENAAATVFRPTDINEKGERIVYLYEDGKRVPVRLGDDQIGKDIFEAFAAVGTENANIAFELATMGTQALRFGVTKAVSYVFNNFLRDQLQTWILSENYTPYATGIKGLKHVIADDAAAGRAAAFGVMMGGIDTNLQENAARDRDISSLRRKGFFAVPLNWPKAMQPVEWTWKTFMRTMEITEAGTRVGHMEAIYQRALADGLTPEEAGWEAAYGANDVMPFDRNGSKMMTIARLVAFLNASVQGMSAGFRTASGERNTYKNYRDAVSPYLKAGLGMPVSVAEKRAIPNAAKIWVKMITIGIIGTAIAALYSGDDDESAEHEEFNDYMRATHWFFKLNGTWFRHPKPFELAVVNNAMEAGFSAAWKQDPRALKQFVQSLRHTMVPPHELQALKLYYEMITGKDTFRDRDIVGMDLRSQSPDYQFNAYTSEFGKIVGRALGWSPAQVDHFMAGALGTMGRDLLNASDFVLPRVNMVTGGVIPGVTPFPRAEKSFEDYWFVSRFTRRASRGALSTEQFWKLATRDGGEFASAAATYKRLADAGRADPRRSFEAKDFLNRLTDEQRAYAYLEGGWFSEKDKDIHPLHRARQSMQAMAGIRKDMLLGQLVKQGTMPDRTHKYREPQLILMTSSEQRVVNEILEDLSMREARNALILVGHPGWKQKQILSTEGLVKELEKASPDVAAELALRLTKGRNRVLPFDQVREAWPKARELLLKNGPDASLSAIRGSYAGRDDIKVLTVPPKTKRNETEQPQLPRVDLPSFPGGGSIMMR